MKGRYEVYCDEVKVASTKDDSWESEIEAWAWASCYEKDGTVDVYRIEGKSKIKLGD